MHHPKQTGTDSHILDPGTRSGDLAGASCRGGSWRSARAEMQSPEVFPLGPFDTLPSSGTSVRSALAAYPRCLVRGVRTESSARAWTRTGRLRRFASVISFSSSFPNASPFNDPCLTKFEPLRLTHPAGVTEPGVEEAGKSAPWRVTSGHTWDCRGIGPTAFGIRAQ
jgi:hypothetical protein